MSVLIWMPRAWWLAPECVSIVLRSGGKVHTKLVYGHHYTLAENLFQVSPMRHESSESSTACPPEPPKQCSVSEHCTRKTMYLQCCPNGIGWHTLEERSSTNPKDW